MVTKDPARTPTFAYFANDDFFITAGSKAAPCVSIAACSDQQPGFNWNHGDFQNDITRTQALTGDASTLGGVDDGLNDLTARRNAIAGRMIAMLEAAAFDDAAIDRDEARQLIDEAQELLASVR